MLIKISILYGCQKESIVGSKSTVIFCSIILNRPLRIACEMSDMERVQTHVLFVSTSSVLQQQQVSLGSNHIFVMCLNKRSAESKCAWHEIA